MSQPVYDLVIAGAGITGLYVATQYLKKNPNHSVLIVERNNYLGGRVYTHRPYILGKGIYQWEAGAGRISMTHSRVIGLITHYGLTFQRWIAPPNLEDSFPDLIPLYLEPLLALSPSVLGQHTLGTLLRRIHGTPKADHFMKKFPYWAEFHTLRADLALDAFLRGALGGQQVVSGSGWGGCTDGLSALMERMGEDVRTRGGEIQLQTSVVQVDLEGMTIQIVSHDKGYKKDQIHAKKIVMALDATSLRKVKGVAEHVSALRHLIAEPLLRVYAVFPVHKGRSWFSEMAKQVFPSSPIRFFIPIQAEKGLAMISYTEGRDAEHWMAMSEGIRKKRMMTELRRIFPENEIPDPLFIKFHHWKTGCTYWLPGNYDPYQLSHESIQPDSSKELYLCNESFAIQQSWMESGLEQADHVLQRII